MDIAVPFSGPRRLFVRAAHPYYPGLYTGLHAPVLDGPAEGILSWWDDASKMLERFLEGAAPHVLLCDASVNLGRVRNRP